MNHALLILFVIALSEIKRQFPSVLRSLTDTNPGNVNGNIMVTKKVYEQKERCSANGTGKAGLKVLYQNGGNVDKPSI